MICAAPYASNGDQISYSAAGATADKDSSAARSFTSSCTTRNLSARGNLCKSLNSWSDNISRLSLHLAIRILRGCLNQHDLVRRQLERLVHNRVEARFQCYDLGGH